MPWNSTTKRMTAPVSIKDIKTALVSSRKDIGGLIQDGCTGASGEPINKWSYIKPIHYPGKGMLEYDDFKGRSIDYNSYGLVYGLKVPRLNGTFTPSEFHSATWEYVGYPNGPGANGSTFSDVSFYRFTDFVNPDNPTTAIGYAKNARPDLTGEIPETSVFYYNPGSTEVCRGVSVVSASYNESNVNAGGVRLAEYIVKMSQSEIFDDEALSKCWPCIIIGNYITALTDVDSGTALPIMTQNGSSYSRNDGPWFVDTYCDNPADSSAATSRKKEAPFSTAQNLPATLVLLYQNSGNRPTLLPTDPSSDLDYHWVELSPDQAWSARIVPFPDACGVTIQMSQKVTSTIANITMIVQTQTGFTVTYAYANSYQGDATISITCDVTQVVGPITSQYQYTGTVTDHNPVGRSDAQFARFYTMDFTYTEIGMLVGTGETITVDASISTTIGSTTTPGIGGETTYTT